MKSGYLFKSCFAALLYSVLAQVSAQPADGSNEHGAMGRIESVNAAGSALKIDGKEYLIDQNAAARCSEAEPSTEGESLRLHAGQRIEYKVSNYGNLITEICVIRAVH